MRSIWAIAVNTVKQAIRMKVAVVFILLLLILLPVMGAVMTGDGTPRGRLQAFVSYSLSLTALLLSLLTILVSIYSLASDFTYKQMFTVLTKPVRRFEFILGKLLGVILLDLVLLFLFASVMYAIVIYMPTYLDVTEDQQAVLNNEFYTARAALRPLEEDVSKEVEKEYKDILQKNVNLKIPAKKIKKKIAEQKRIANRAVPSGQELIFKFQNIKMLDPNEKLFLRFKYDVSTNPPDLQIYGKWIVGDDRQTVIQTPVYAFERKDVIRTFHEIEILANAIAYDNYLAVGFYNDPQLNNTVVIFPPNEGLEVLFKADTFTVNFVRAVILIMLRLIFLAVLGIMAATFLSMYVAVLMSLVIFFTALLSNFVVESFSYLGENISSVYSLTFKPLLYLLPQFDKFSPVKFMVSARLLSWSFLAEAAVSMVCVKTLLLLLLALWIFSRREVAKITV